MQMDYYIVSLDPAQLQDWSALAAIKVSGTDYKIVSISRKQKLPYTAPEGEDSITAWSKHVFNDPQIRFIEGQQLEPTFLVDASGLGGPVQQILTNIGVAAIGITYTSGLNSFERVSARNYHVSKTFMIGRFLAAWDDGRVQRPRLARWRGDFEKELKAFRGKLSSMGRAQFEASQGEHDDQVMAVAQAIWFAEQFAGRMTIPIPNARDCHGGGLSDERLIEMGCIPRHPQRSTGWGYDGRPGEDPLASGSGETLQQQPSPPQEGRMKGLGVCR